MHWLSEASQVSDGARGFARLVHCLAIFAAVMLAAWPHALRADDVSQPAMLQMFEAKWQTIENRMPDIFQTGYGQMWLPPPERADTGNLSVGYDLFDRFDLGSPQNETLYGTELALKSEIAAAHSAGIKSYTDLIWNHNGFRNQTNATFVAQGGYPGFAMTVPGDPNGDFHDPSISFSNDPVNGELSGLDDIAQEKNYQFIRQPTDPANPNNIPAGTIYNKPDPNNARFYPDQALGGTTFTDPALNTTLTRYNFNNVTPLAGDPVSEDALGLLMRNAQWMIQAIGVDGFRVDAAKHMPPWVLNYLDEATFRASNRTNLDGSIVPAYEFSEVADGNKGFVQQFIRHDLPNSLGISPTDTTIHGNRDALDFPLFYAMVNNLSGNGLQNNWHNIANASMDMQDDGLHNGSQGVSFVDSQDNQASGFPYLRNVAYAYTLEMPGNAIVYMNAQQFGSNRSFPHNGANGTSQDALGGYYGNTIAKLVDIRNTHGRGNFHERWLDDAFNPNGFSNIYVYERENSMIVGLNSRLDSGYDERDGVQTSFAPGTVLVELTGNADDPVVDPTNSIPDSIRVNASGQINIRIPRNDTNGKGYVIYGVAGPQGNLSLTNVASVMAGATPSQATNGTVRLANIDVITGNSFNVHLDTSPVTLPAPVGESNPVRDPDADANQAVIRVDDGSIPGLISGVVTNPSDVSYGFGQFTDVDSPGYVDNGQGIDIGTGTGSYQQSIDVTKLTEGTHYITVRAYRHRASGPAVYTDFKQTIYVDRLPPPSQILSFDPLSSQPNNPNNRNLIVQSTDGTASKMNIFLDLPAGLSDADILAKVQQGQNQASYYDRDKFVMTFSGLPKGNHVATVVAVEPDGNYSIKRVPGYYTNTTIGAGFGDLDYDGLFTTADIRGTNNFSAEDVLYSQNTKFKASFDLNGDGLCDDRDLFALGGSLVAAGAGQAVLDSYQSLLLHRGDVDGSGTTDTADVNTIYGHFGSNNWTYDINSDGVVNSADVLSMVTQVFRSTPGDFNLDGVVDANDYAIWKANYGSGTLYTQGDANLDGKVDAADYTIWRDHLGFHTLPLGAGTGIAASVPEPPMLGLCGIGTACILILRGPGRRRNSQNVDDRCNLFQLCS
jgi:glycosidase